jgi:hypothetical protein
MRAILVEAEVRVDRREMATVVLREGNPDLMREPAQENGRADLGARSEERRRGRGQKGLEELVRKSISEYGKKKREREKLPRQRCWTPLSFRRSYGKLTNRRKARGRANALSVRIWNSEDDSGELNGYRSTGWVKGLETSR